MQHDRHRPSERGQHIATIKEVFGAVQEIREIPDGYSFRLPNETTFLTKAAEFIAKERFCCPFFGFTLPPRAQGGALWLSSTGRERVEPFIQAEIAAPLAGGIATSFLLELTVYPAIFAIWKGRRLAREREVEKGSAGLVEPV